jgi:hypothetical protein
MLQYVARDSSAFSTVPIDARLIRATLNWEAKWGVPHWLDEIDHPLETQTGWEWAWEFLRRNHAYRSFWVDKIQPDGGVWKNSNGEHWSYLSDLQRQFGVDVLSSPDSRRACHFVAGWTHSVRGSQAPRGGAEGQTKAMSIELADNQVAFVVDLDRPLAKQIAAISRIAGERQQDKFPTTKLSRKSRNLKTYLRLLDARDADAKRVEIEETLFAEVDNSYPERLRSKTFDNCERAARLLRDLDYLKLLSLN